MKASNLLSLILCLFFSFSALAEEKMGECGEPEKNCELAKEGTKQVTIMKKSTQVIDAVYTAEEAASLRKRSANAYDKSGVKAPTGDSSRESGEDSSAD